MVNHTNIRNLDYFHFSLQGGKPRLKAGKHRKAPQGEERIARAMCYLKKNDYLWKLND